MCIMKNETKVPRRCGWTNDEDSILLKHANRYLARNVDIDYRFIATQIPSRTTKQVRERYENSLAPKNRGDWAHNELLLLVELMTIHGQNWAKIRDMLSARSYNAIKKKGRKILGEMSPNKRVKSVSATRRRRRIQSTSVDLKMKATTSLKETKGTQDEELSRLVELHREFRYDWKCILELLGSSKSQAELERTLYQNCDCKTCTDIRTKIEESMKSCRETFKQAWTKLKAKEKKKELMNYAAKKSTYASPDKVTEQASSLKGYKTDSTLPNCAQISAPMLFNPHNFDASFTMPLSNHLCKVSATPNISLGSHSFFNGLPTPNMLVSNAISQPLSGYMQPTTLHSSLLQPNTIPQQFFNGSMYINTKIQ